MVKYLRAANVNDGELDIRDVKAMNFSPSEQKLFSLQPGDVLVTEGSGSISAVGASAVWQGEIPGTVCFQNTLLRLRPRHGIIDGRFLAWWARASYASGQFAAIAGGANIHHLSAERVRALSLMLPSLEEQHHIADFLDVETAQLKALITAKERQIRVINEDAFVAISETVLPGSVSVPRGRGLMPWLPKTELSEPLVRLGYVASLQTGVTVDNARQIDGVAITRPYVRVANVQAGGLDLTTITEITVPVSVARRSSLRYGDVLMTEGGDLDKLGRGTVWRNEIPDCLHQNHVFAIRTLLDRLDPEYLALVTQSLHGRCYFESTGVKTTNLASTSAGKILAFPIPLPLIEVQHRRVQELRIRLECLDRCRSVLRSQLCLLRERQQASIAAAVAGKITL